MVSIYREFNYLENIIKKSIVVIGNFDGVHLGHKAVLNYAKSLKNNNNEKVVVLTFYPHPLKVLRPEYAPKNILSFRSKVMKMKELGIDIIVAQRFNKKFSNISAENFIKKIIYKKIRPKSLAVSNNFKFGRNRKGNVNLLKKFGKKFDYQVFTIKPFKHLKKIVSSTKIRKLLKNGNIDLANKLLSRTWSIEGRVAKGKKIGRKLGYRTCNINVKNYILPKKGIYAVKIAIGNKKNIYGGVAYLGSRPTFGGGNIFLEINIFGIKKNLYKKRLKVFFLKFLRKDKKFDNPAQLIRQMNKDVIFAKKSLKTKIVL